MARKIEDLSGRTFGRLKVLEIVDDTYNHIPIYRCLCECGKECRVYGNNLKAGKTKSCGCLRSQRMRMINEYRRMAR